MHVTDKTIRNAITSRVLRFKGREGVVRLVEELELQQGAARIDMAFFGNDLLGVEIKSPRDSLSRLPDQAQVYSRVFDRVYIVAAEPFMQKVLGIVPEWWGVIAIHQSEARVFFRAVRAAETNPRVDAAALIDLLWKEELLEMLRLSSNEPIRIRRPRADLRLDILEATSHDKIKAFSLEAFKKRQNWRETKLGLAK